MPSDLSALFSALLYSFRPFLFALFLPLCLFRPFAGFGQSGQVFSSLLYSCYEVESYELEIKLNAKTQRIAGSSFFHLNVIHPTTQLQFDLEADLKILRIEWEGTNLRYGRKGSVVTLEFPRQLPANRPAEFRVLFGGNPARSLGSPLPWQQDQQGRELLVFTPQTTQGLAWWPQKLSLSDPVESLQLAVIYDEGPTVISSGQLLGTEAQAGKFVKWNFGLKGPVLPQNLEIYLGQFVESQATYRNAAGIHQLRYLTSLGSQVDGNERLQAMLEIFPCLEAFYGPYPFDGTGLNWVDLPGLGQANRPIAGDVPHSPDQEALVHQLAAAWWGRAIQPYQAEDRWIIEAFQAYSWLLVESCSAKPILSLGQETPSGALFLHSLRKLTDNDETWFAACRTLVADFRNQSISTKELTDFLDWKLGLPVADLVDHYLRYPEPPVLEYAFDRKRQKTTLYYRWRTPDAYFAMPVDVILPHARERLTPTSDWQVFSEKGVQEKHVRFDPDFGWIEYQKINRR